MVIVNAAQTESLPFSNIGLELDGYKSTPASNSVERLRIRLAKGEAGLEFDPKFGFLTGLLRELEIPASSQLLVASKTSPNKGHISPRNPRALYFNDSTALAFVPGAGLVELAVSDPKLGVAFYTLEQKMSDHPQLVRDDRCLECHASAKSLGVPGWLVRSFVTHSDGEVDLLSGLMVTHSTPIAERWGGYYVTGDTGGQRHRGNFFGDSTTSSPIREAPVVELDSTRLGTFLDVTKFPVNSSDVVSLLEIEHQVHMMNLITRLMTEAGSVGESEGMERLKPAAEAALKYLLFVDEASLLAPVRGSAEFVRQFEVQGPFDSQGRSLRQFDLQKKLFKFPCSYMIYSPGFDALPLRARRHFYKRLWDVLNGDDASPKFKTLSLEARKAIREILVQTKHDLPAYWRL